MIDAYHATAIILVVAALAVWGGYALGRAVQRDFSKSRLKVGQAQAWTDGYTSGVRDTSNAINTLGATQRSVTLNPYAQAAPFASREAR